MRGLLGRAQKALTAGDYRRLKAIVDALESLNDLMGVSPESIQTNEPRAAKGGVK